MNIKQIVYKGSAILLVGTMVLPMLISDVKASNEYVLKDVTDSVGEYTEPIGLTSKIPSIKELHSTNVPQLTSNITDNFANIRNGERVILDSGICGTTKWSVESDLHRTNGPLSIRVDIP